MLESTTEVCPFDGQMKFSMIKLGKCMHELDYLYSMMVCDQRG